jgi:hypothetical protein
VNIISRRKKSKFSRFLSKSSLLNLFQSIRGITEDESLTKSRLLFHGNEHSPDAETDQIWNGELDSEDRR